MTEAKYIDIKRFAVHDGPGIRTTLFLKGCSLHCIWCHNPESRRKSPELAYYSHKCSLCGKCSEICSCHKIIGNQHIFDRNSCIVCGKCEDVCPRKLIRLVPASAQVHVYCNSLEKPAIKRKNCSAACISCKKCFRLDPEHFNAQDQMVRVKYGNPPSEAIVEEVKCPTGALQSVKTHLQNVSGIVKATEKQEKV